MLKAWLMGTYGITILGQQHANYSTILDQQHAKYSSFGQVKNVFDIETGVSVMHVCLLHNINSAFVL